MAPAPRPALAAATAARSPGLRRYGPPDLGPKAARTRAAVLAAARAVFTEHGFLQSTVAQIAERAGVSLGTFYQYFRDRSDVMAHLVGDAVVEALARDDSAWKAGEGRAGLRRVIGGYVEGYARTAPFLAVWEEVTHVDPELANVRRDLSRLLTERIETELREAAALGVVRADLDPAIAARALSAMVDRYCYLTFVFDPPPGRPPVERSADVLTELWAGAIGLAG